MVLATLTPEERVGPYIVEGELGRGQYGIAYLAWDSLGNRDVVLKHASDPREADALRELSEHPHCAEFLLCLREVIQYRGRDYLVLEYIPGVVLEDQVFPLEELWVMLGQLLEALVDIHSRGYTHEDIHPRNIMWTGTEVRLIDFGRAGRSPPGDMSYRYDVAFALHSIMGNAEILSPLNLAFMLRKGKVPVTLEDYHQYYQNRGIALDPIQERMIQMYLAYQDLANIPDLEHLSARMLEAYFRIEEVI